MEFWVWFFKKIDIFSSRLLIANNEVFAMENNEEYLLMQNEWLTKVEK